MSVQDIRNKLEQQKGQLTQIKTTISDNKTLLRTEKRKLKKHEQAREIMRVVALKTQEQIQYHIGDLTSMALEAVFDDPYELVVEFVKRRNKTECDLYFARDGNKIDPLSASGGGAVDVAAFALRIASWSMTKPHTRNVILLDEPFKHLKGQDANLRVLEMVREISKKLNLQIIMVSDERIPREDIIANADKVFETKIRKGITTVS
jgi:DNA repair exonuclease SbcCD ATPase subunit